MTGNTDVIERDLDIFAFQIFHGYALIDHRAVPRGAPQGLSQRFRGGRNIIEPPQFSKIDGLSKVKSEQFVGQGVRDEIEKADLMSDIETSVTITDSEFSNLSLHDALPL